MPNRKIRIHKSTKDAISSYIDIRYSHWTEDERRIHKNKVGRELERRNSLPDEYGENSEQEYRDKVKAFFKRNQDFLDQHDKSVEGIRETERLNKAYEAKIEKLFKMPEKERIALIKKHGGIVNDALKEV